MIYIIIQAYETEIYKNEQEGEQCQKYHCFTEYVLPCIIMTICHHISMQNIMDKKH